MSASEVRRKKAERRLLTEQGGRWFISCLSFLGGWRGEGAQSRRTEFIFVIQAPCD